MIACDVSHALHCMSLVWLKEKKKSSGHITSAKGPKSNSRVPLEYGASTYSLANHIGAKKTKKKKKATAGNTWKAGFWPTLTILP